MPITDRHSAINPDLQPFKYNGKELDMMHGLNTYDYGARQYDPTLGRWDRMDPLCEKYDNVSPYAYCWNNPVNRIDPDGHDYWSTNDPIQIKAFFNTMGAGYRQFDFSQWNHATDAQFVSSLTYNDETHKFYTSYGEVINGEATIIGKSFDADLTPVSFSGKGYIGAFAFEPYSGFWEQARYYWNGGIEEFGGQSWKVNISGRITGYTQ